METLIRVLSIGAGNTIGWPEGVAFNHEFQIIVADGYGELLWAAPAAQNIGVAVLNPSLGLDELARCARVVRLRWPGARIPMVRAEEPLFDDALYDDRIEPGLSAEMLLAAIEDIQRSGSEKGQGGDC